MRQLHVIEAVVFAVPRRFACRQHFPHRVLDFILVAA